VIPDRAVLGIIMEIQSTVAQYLVLLARRERGEKNKVNMQFMKIFETTSSAQPR
jgi:hypothetical protein